MTALTGVRVIELADEKVAFAGKLMADMGADVILVEPPGGDATRHYPPFLDDVPDPEQSLYFWHYNTSKRGVVLDLDDPGDQTTFRRLVASADVLLEAQPTQRLAGLRLDYPDLSATNPNLIHIAVTPYGRNEPASESRIVRAIPRDYPAEHFQAPAGYRPGLGIQVGPEAGP